jgi:hypothetical protein
MSHSQSLSLIFLFTCSLCSCLPLGIGGNVDGRDLEFVSATYFELRGIDPATSIEFHEIDLWLMPMENSCETFPELLSELADLRSQIDSDSLLAEDYCDAWETAFASRTGLDGFWMAQMRLNALPRDDNEDIEMDYIFVDDASEAIPSSPHFDGSLAWYPPATFDACAQEFSGSDLFTADHFGADGGIARMNNYAEDTEVTITLEPSFPSDGGGLAGKSTAEFCPGAAEWPIDFGLGL